MVGKFEWIPLVSVGPVKFGDSIETHLDSGFAIEEEFDDEPDYIDQDDVLGFRIGEDDSTIESVWTMDELVYRGRNLVGLSRDALIELLGESPNDEETEEEPTDQVMETMLSFDKLGLLVWLRDERVHSVMVDNGQ